MISKPLNVFGVYSHKVIEHHQELIPGEYVAIVNYHSRCALFLHTPIIPRSTVSLL